MEEELQNKSIGIFVKDEASTSHKKTSASCSINPSVPELLPTFQSILSEPIPTTAPVVSAVASSLFSSEYVFHTKSWHHAEDHTLVRDTMVQCVSHLIQQRRPNATNDWIEKLPEVARRVEERLYFLANSYDEYNDPHTLIDRLHFLVQFLIEEANRKSTLQGDDNMDDKDNMEGDEDDYNDDDDSQDSISDSMHNSNSNSGTKQNKLKKMKLKNNSKTGNQVSSQGCSRVFIVKVLRRISDFVKGKFLPSIFTFRKELVTKWLNEAKDDCMSPSYESEELFYGGPPFQHDDPSTHWSEAHQLYTWWKNNVERRSKFKVLQEDAAYDGVDHRRIARARWCEMVIALSEVIRSSSGSSVATRASADESYLDPSASLKYMQRSTRPISALDKSSKKRRLQHETDMDDESINAVDFSEDESETRKSTRKVVKSMSTEFPAILYDLVEADDETSIGWLEDNSGFEVKDVDEFVDRILPTYFQFNNFTTFKRHLQVSGFLQIADKGQAICAYRHESFLPGRRDLLQHMLGEQGGGEGRRRFQRRKTPDENSFSSLQAIVNSEHTKGLSKSTNSPNTEWDRHGRSKRYRGSDDISDPGTNSRKVQKGKSQSLAKKDLSQSQIHRGYSRSGRAIIASSRLAGSDGEEGEQQSHFDSSEEQEGDPAEQEAKNSVRSARYRNEIERTKDRTTEIKETKPSYSSEIHTIDLTGNRARKISIDFTVGEGARTVSRTTERSSTSRLDVPREEGPKCSRVGDHFQAVVPEWKENSMSDSDDFDTAEPELLWTPSMAPLESEPSSLPFNLQKHPKLLPGDIVIAFINDLQEQSEIIAEISQPVDFEDDNFLKRKSSSVMSAYRLACIVSIHFPSDASSSSSEEPFEGLTSTSQDSSQSREPNLSYNAIATIFDGFEESEVPISSCKRYIWKLEDCDDFNRQIGHSQTRTHRREESFTFSSGQWTPSEVQKFCDCIKRNRDDLYKIYPNLSRSKSYKEVVDFYNRLYSHVRIGGSRRLLRIFRRAAAVTPRLTASSRIEASEDGSVKSEQEDTMANESECVGSSQEDIKLRHSSLPVDTRTHDNRNVYGADFETISSGAVESAVVPEGGSYGGFLTESNYNVTTDCLSEPSDGKNILEHTYDTNQTNSDRKRRGVKYGVEQQKSEVRDEGTPMPHPSSSLPFTRPPRRGTEREDSTGKRGDIRPAREGVGSSVLLRGIGTRSRNRAIVGETNENPEPNSIYCVCQGKVDSSFLITCKNHVADCLSNGWVHARCVGVEESIEAILAVGDFVCPPCKLLRKTRTRGGKQNNSDDEGQHSVNTPTIHKGTENKVESTPVSTNDGRRSGRVRKPARTGSGYDN